MHVQIKVVVANATYHVSSNIADSYNTMVLQRLLWEQHIFLCQLLYNVRIVYIIYIYRSRCTFIFPSHISRNGHYFQMLIMDSSIKDRLSESIIKLNGYLSDSNFIMGFSYSNKSKMSNIFTR